MMHQNGHNPEVLIVEDNEAQRRVLLDMIRVEGFQVQAFATPEEALAQVAEHTFAVAIIDHRLPGMTGTALLEKISALQPGVRAIIHTGFGSFESAKEAVNLGAFAYVEKLGEPEELLRHVHRAAQDWMGEALQRSQENYRHLIESVQAVVWRGEPDTLQITFVSREAEAMLGYATQEWLAPNFWKSHIHPDDRATILDVCAEAVRGLQPHVLEYRMMAADGGIVWVRDLVNVIVEDDQAQELVGVMMDITDRKRMEESLRRRDAILSAVSFATEELLQSDSLEGGLETVLARLGQSTEAGRVYIFENETSPDGTIIASPFAKWVAPGIDPQAEHLTLHRTAYDAIGFSRWRRLLSQGTSINGPVRTFPEAERAMLEAQHIRSLAAVPIFVDEAFWGFMGFDDCEVERVWPDIVMEALKMAANILGAAIEQRQAAREIRLLAQALRSAREGVCITDLDDTIVFVNQAFQEIYGYREEELMGQPVTIVRSPAHPPAEDPLRLPSEQRDAWQGELWNQRKDGTIFPVLLSTSAVRNEAGEPVAYVGVASDITEQKQAEEALRESEERHRTLLNHLPVGVYRTTPEGTIVNANPAMADLLGVDTPEALQQIPADKLPFSVPERERQLEQLGHEAIYTAEFCLQRPNGDNIWVRDYPRVVKHPDGTIAFIDGILLDITERKQAQETARHRAEQLQLSQQIAQLGSWEWDLQTGVLHWSEESHHIFGVPPGTTLEWDEVRDRFIVEEDRAIVDHCLQTALHEPHRVADLPPMEYRIRRPDGEVRTLWSNTVVYYDDQQRPVRLVCAMQDITERKKAEEALRASEAHNKALIQAIPDTLFSFDRAGVILDYVPTREFEGAMPPEEYIGKTIYDGFPRKMAEESMGALRQALDTGDVQEYAYGLRLGGEMHHFEARFVPIGHDAVLSIVRDVTERWIAEEALQVSQARLAQAQRIAHLGYWEWNLATDTHVWSDETYRLMDLEPQSMEPDQQLFLDYVHPDDRAAVRAHMEARLAGKETDVMEFRILRAGGRVHWVWTESLVHRDEAGQPVCVIGAIQDITERKEAAARLQYLAIVLSNVSDAIISTDLDFRVQSWNAAAEALYGWSEAEVLGRHIQEVIPTRYTDETTDEQAIDALMTGGYWGGEVVQHHRDGTPLHVLSSVALVRGSDGTPVGVVAANRDISERKQMEEALRASEEKFAKAFRSSPDSITLSRLSDGLFLEVNEGFERMSGYSRAEALGEHSQALGVWLPSDHERMVTMLQTQGAVRGMEAAIRRKNGVLRHCLVSAEIIELEGEPCLVAIARDITERKKAEEALRKSETSFRLMFEHNPIPMWVFDRETLKFLDVNDAAVTAYGYAREEFLSMTITDIRPEDELPRLNAFLDEDVLSAAIPTEWQHRTKDGTVIDVEVTAHAFPYRDRPARLVLANDVTERKRLQKEILEISNREQRRIGRDLHDGLGQVLTGIGFRIEALEGDLRRKEQSLAEETVEIAELVEMAIAQSRALARGLNPVNVEQQGLPAALHELTQSIQSIYGMPCTFTCPRPVQVPDLEVATHLYRIAQEAIGNAVKHAQASQIDVHLDVQDDLVTLRVEDNGRGISASSSQEAEGMGLRIMNYRSNMIGGLFSVSSTRTGGTIVTCQFSLSSLHEPAV